MKILILLLNSLIITSQNDPKAEDLLNKVSENIKAYESMYININHNLSNEEEDIDQTNKVYRSNQSKMINQTNQS